MPNTVASRTVMPLPAARVASSASTFVFPYRLIGLSGLSSVQNAPFSPMPYPLFVFGRMIRCCFERRLSSSLMASRLMVVAAVGSRLHAGAPTTAARGIITSASLSAFSIVALSRQSPRVTLKPGWMQQSARLFCWNQKLSST